MAAETSIMGRLGWRRVEVRFIPTPRAFALSVSAAVNRSGWDLVFEILANQSWEGLNINGLGSVSVTTRVQRLLLVPLHRQCGERDYHNVHGFWIGLQPTGHLKAVHAR